MALYVDWPTVTVVIVIATIITLIWQALRLAIWSTKIILRLCNEIRPPESVKSRENLPARDGATV